MKQPRNDVVHIIPVIGITEEMTYNGDTLCGINRWDANVECRSIATAAWVMTNRSYRSAEWRNTCEACADHPEVHMAVLARVQL